MSDSWKKQCYALITLGFDRTVVNDIGGSFLNVVIRKTEYTKEVMGKILIDINKINTAYMRMNLALASSMTDADADEGQMIVMDMQASSVIGHASLKKHNGEGGFVFRSQRVKEVSFIGVTLGDTLEYLDTRDVSAMPLRIIMPAVSYLTLLEFGLKPTDEVTWTGGVSTLDELFLQGHYKPLVECAAMIELIGINNLNAVLSRLGFLPNGGPDNLELLEKMRIYPFQMVDWIYRLAIGEGLSQVFKPETDNPNGPRKSIKKLQELLQQCGAEAMDQSKGECKTTVNGYSFVSMPDNFLYRDIAFCGSFPADNPKYGVLVWLHKKEESEELQVQERTELGVHAAQVCKSIADYVKAL